MSYKDNKAQFFQHCPQCAEPSGLHTVKKFKCQKCGFKFYFNTAAAVGALITNDNDELLITVRGKEPAKGTWDLPGGFVDPGESAEEALKREIKEELNLDIQSADYFCSVPNTYEYGKIKYSTVDIAYICKVINLAKAKAGSEVCSILFKHHTGIIPEKFGLESIRKIVAYYLSLIH